MTTEERKATFIRQASIKHNNYYNYSEVVFVNQHTPVTVVCPQHGKFSVLPAKHLHRGTACKICNHSKRFPGKLKSNKPGLPKKNPTDAIAKLISKFSNLDFSKFIVTTFSDKSSVTCNIHGEFQSSISLLKTAKYGCQKCGIQRSAAKKQSDTETFIKKARQVHGDLYQYDKTDYVSAKEKLTITCPTHGDFEQLASGHLSGYGCSKCASYGKGRVSDTLPCTFYYLHISGTNLYKVGITTLSLEHRYRTKFDRDQIEVIFTLSFPTGKEAYEYEQSLLQTYSHLRYYGDKVLSTGNTELFTADIFDGTYPSELQLKA